jgi:hypothetical protein
MSAGASLARLIFPERPARFSSQLPPSVAAGRLNAAIDRGVVRAQFTLGAVGKVVDGVATVRWNRPWNRGGGQPVFVGRFDVDAGRTVLAGTFGLARIEKVILGIALAFIVSGWLQTLFGDARRGAHEQMVLWLLPLTIVAMPALTRVGFWFYRRDFERISDVISRALG